MRCGRISRSSLSSDWKSVYQHMSRIRCDNSGRPFVSKVRTGIAPISCDPACAFTVDDLSRGEDHRIDMSEDASSNVWSMIAAVLKRGSIFLVAVGAILVSVG